MTKPTRLLMTLLIVCVHQTIRAQFLDSLSITLGAQATLATQDHQPLWLVANRFGTIADRQADLSSRIRITNTHPLRSSPLPTTISNTPPPRQPITFAYGLDAYWNDHFQNPFLQEAYAAVTYGKWALRAGRYEEIIGEVHPELSSGSLGISGNALPIPKVSIVNTDYVDVPFTKGWLQFKGHFSHGWLGNQRLLQRALLHEKSLYVRFGRGKLKLYGGVQHYGVWGGEKDEEFQLDRSFNGFLNVVFFREANDGSVPPGRLPNRAGFQRGSVDGGLSLEGANSTFRFYTQTPIATGTSITFKNIDRLMGFSLDYKDKNRFAQSLLFELLYTKQMGDFEGAKEPYYYYVNGVYLTGWNYQGRVIGTPLLLNRTRTSRYFEEVEEPAWDPEDRYSINYNMPSNRVMAAHLGFRFRPFKRLNGKTLLTFTRNYGNENSRPQFGPHRDQWYALQQLSFTATSNLRITTDLGIDWGELSDNIGIMLGVEWNFVGADRNPITASAAELPGKQLLQD